METTTKPYYKVLVNGQSCHGGAYQWSLPIMPDGPAADEWIPGDWHVFDGALALCVKGFHVTTDPAHWWKDGCSVYEAEIDGTIGGQDSEKAKVVVARVRLLRPVLMVKLPGGWQIQQMPSRSSGWSDPKRTN